MCQLILSRMIHAQSQITKLFITLVNSHVIVIYVYYSINYIRFILSSVSFIGKCSWSCDREIWYNENGRRIPENGQFLRVYFMGRFNS